MANMGREQLITEAFTPLSPCFAETAQLQTHSAEMAAGSG